MLKYGNYLKNRGYINYLKNGSNLKKRARYSSNAIISEDKVICPREIARDTFLPGKEFNGFRVRQIKDVDSLQLTAVRLEHVSTGADYVHIARNDPNNVFSIYFKTPPANSTGVPHILEHSVLCGSEKYPCRDPFFKMLNRSLSTFMNAMTGSDYTFYPFSTQHDVDFRNLMSVYLDAVLKPNLNLLDFLQEGWRLEHENVDDKESPIIFKGVVLNEMKGVFADPQMVFMQKLQNEMLPSDTYGHVSGGDPMNIPELSWEELRDFHAKHYHPSNSRIYTYGDQPLENHLSYINDNYLVKFKKIIPNTTVKSENQWSTPQRKQISCNPDSMSAPDKQTSVAVSYMLTHINDNFDNFVLSILSELLMGGPNSAFYKSLLEPQIGSGFSPTAGFDNSTLNTTFTVGLQGIAENDVEKVTDIINNTFEKVIKEGFKSDEIEGVLHRIELSMKHQTSNFGLGIAMNLSAAWNHGANPLDLFDINEKIEKFRKLLKENPSYLNEKVEEYFMKNNHKLILSMSPSVEHEVLQAEKEKLTLEKRLKSLSSNDKEKIWALGKDLKSKQELKDDISVLPTLNVSDINRNIPATPLSLLSLKNIPTYVHELPTNGVVYFRSMLSLNDVPKELYHLIPIFTSVLTQMGAGNLDFRSFDKQVELVSGGLGVDTHVSQNPNDIQQYEQGIYLASHCLAKNYEPMLNLWSKVFNDVRLQDVDRFSTLVRMTATDCLNGLIHQGHRYATSFSASNVNFVANVQEKWGGLTYLNLLKELSESEDLGSVLKDIKTLAFHILKNPHMRISLNFSPNDSDLCINQTEKFLTEIGESNAWSNSLSTIPGDFSPSSCQNHHLFQFPVNFAAKSFPTVHFTHPDTGPIQVLARLMFQFLHREIREKGGAYGGGSMVSPGSSFSFYSYRDPHSVRTLNTFDSSIDWILSDNFEQREIDEAKLGVFQKLDAPVSPGSRGIRNFCNNISDEQFANMRCSVLDTKREDIIDVCQKYLKNAPFEGACLIGPQNDELCKATKQNWAVINH